MGRVHPVVKQIQVRIENRPAERIVDAGFRDVHESNIRRVVDDLIEKELDIEELNRRPSQAKELCNFLHTVVLGRCRGVYKAGERVRANVN